MVTGTYQRFLQVCNAAHRQADPAQRKMIRELAAQQLSPEEATYGIEQIMGWHA